MSSLQSLLNIVNDNVNLNKDNPFFSNTIEQILDTDDILNSSASNPKNTKITFIIGKLFATIKTNFL